MCCPRDIQLNTISKSIKHFHTLKQSMKWINIIIIIVLFAPAMESIIINFRMIDGWENIIIARRDMMEMKWKIANEGFSPLYTTVFIACIQKCSMANKQCSGMTTEKYLFTMFFIFLHKCRINEKWNIYRNISGEMIANE